MAKRSSFNLSETIREYRKAHRGVTAMDALEGIRKALRGAEFTQLVATACRIPNAADAGRDNRLGQHVQNRDTRP
jgi:hypothetical protein